MTEPEASTSKTLDTTSVSQTLPQSYIKVNCPQQATVSCDSGGLLPLSEWSCPLYAEKLPPVSSHIKCVGAEEANKMEDAGSMPELSQVKEIQNQERIKTCPKRPAGVQCGLWTEIGEVTPSSSKAAGKDFYNMHSGSSEIDLLRSGVVQQDLYNHGICQHHSGKGLAQHVCWTQHRIQFTSSKNLNERCSKCLEGRLIRRPSLPARSERLKPRQRPRPSSLSDFDNVSGLGRRTILERGSKNEFKSAPSEPWGSRKVSCSRSSCPMSSDQGPSQCDVDHDSDAHLPPDLLEGRHVKLSSESHQSQNDDTSAETIKHGVPLLSNSQTPSGLAGDIRTRDSDLPKRNNQLTPIAEGCFTVVSDTDASPGQSKLSVPPQNAADAWNCIDCDTTEPELISENSNEQSSTNNVGGNHQTEPESPTSKGQNIRPLPILVCDKGRSVNAPPPIADTTQVADGSQAGQTGDGWNLRWANIRESHKSSSRKHQQRDGLRLITQSILEATRNQPCRISSPGRTQVPHHREGRRPVVTFIHSRDAFPGTGAQMVALGLRRSSSIISEPDLHARRKPRYENILMQRSKARTKAIKAPCVKGRDGDIRTFNRGFSGIKDRRNVIVDPQAKSTTPLFAQKVSSQCVQQGASHEITEQPTKKCTNDSLEEISSVWFSRETALQLERFPCPAIYLLGSDCVLRSVLTLITPTDTERELKRTTFNALSAFLKTWKGNKIRLYVAGSTAYNVDSTSSDLDVVVTTSDTDHLSVLQDLCERIRLTQRRCGPDGNSLWPLHSVEMQLVHNARVPILLLKLPEGVVCDVSVNTDNSISHTEFFKAILRDKDHLRALMRLIKYWVKVRRLPAMRDGGLPSIVWMLLCVFSCRLSEVCYSATAISLASSPSTMGSNDNGVNSEKIARPYGDTAIQLNNNTTTTVHATSSGSEGTSKNEKGKAVSPEAALNRFSSSFTRWIWSLSLSATEVSRLAPFTILLGEFFSRLCSRKEMTSTVSVAAGLFISKNENDVAKRILSPPFHGGVWDEILSVEDPADYDRNFFPNALLIRPDILLERNLVAPNVSANGIPTPVFKDLASKVSSATWLVYQFELKRADALLWSFVDSEKSFVKALERARKMSTRHRPEGAPADVKLLDSQLERLSNLFVQLFADNPEARYRVPAHCDLNAKADADDNEKYNFCLILLDGKLMIVKLVKVCADRCGWWSNEFLSRRDIRSVLHGRPFYSVVIPRLPNENNRHLKTPAATDNNDNNNNTSNTTEQWLLCSSSYMDKVRFYAATQGLSSALLSDDNNNNNNNNKITTTLESPMLKKSPPPPLEVNPSMRRELGQQESYSEYSMFSGDSDFEMDEDDVVVLFNPCNLVCFLQAQSVSEEIYLLPSTEVSIITSMVQLAKASPYWYDKVPGYQPLDGMTSFGVPLQPAVSVCKHCSTCGLVTFIEEKGFPHEPFYWLHLAKKLPSLSFLESFNWTEGNEVELELIKTALSTFLLRGFNEEAKCSILKSLVTESMTQKPSSLPKRSVTVIHQLACMELTRLTASLPISRNVTPMNDISGAVTDENRISLAAATAATAASSPPPPPTVPLFEEQIPSPKNQMKYRPRALTSLSRSSQSSPLEWKPDANSDSFYKLQAENGQQRHNSSVMSNNNNNNIPHNNSLQNLSNAPPTGLSASRGQHHYSESVDFASLHHPGVGRYVSCQQPPQQQQQYVPLNFNSPQPIFSTHSPGVDLTQLVRAPQFLFSAMPHYLGPVQRCTPQSTPVASSDSPRFRQNPLMSFSVTTTHSAAETLGQGSSTHSSNQSISPGRSHSQMMGLSMNNIHQQQQQQQQQLPSSPSINTLPSIQRNVTDSNGDHPESRPLQSPTKIDLHGEADIEKMMTERTMRNRLLERHSGNDYQPVSTSTTTTTAWIPIQQHHPQMIPAGSACQYIQTSQGFVELKPVRSQIAFHQGKPMMVSSTQPLTTTTTTGYIPVQSSGENGQQPQVMSLMSPNLVGNPMQLAAYSAHPPAMVPITPTHSFVLSDGVSEYLPLVESNQSFSGSLKSTTPDDKVAGEGSSSSSNPQAVSISRYHQRRIKDKPSPIPIITLSNQQSTPLVLQVNNDFSSSSASKNNNASTMSISKEVDNNGEDIVARSVVSNEQQLSSSNSPYLASLPPPLPLMCDVDPPAFRLSDTNCQKQVDGSRINQKTTTTPNPNDSGGAVDLATATFDTLLPIQAGRVSLSDSPVSDGHDSPLASSHSAASSFSHVRVPNKRREDLPRYIPPSQRCFSSQKSANRSEGGDSVVSPYTTRSVMCVTPVTLTSKNSEELGEGILNTTSNKATVDGDTERNGEKRGKTARRSSGGGGASCHRNEPTFRDDSRHDDGGDSHGVCGKFDTRRQSSGESWNRTTDHTTDRRRSGGCKDGSSQYKEGGHNTNVESCGSSTSPNCKLYEGTGGNTHKDIKKPHVTSNRELKLVVFHKRGLYCGVLRHTVISSDDAVNSADSRL